MTAQKGKPELARTIQPDEANANPTKAFFISLITRDVNITDCIKDLVDNAIDGAIRNGHRQPISKFRIDLKVCADKFVITDNCGGIELKVAKEYAFRFGRPEDKVERDQTISGRYGIGMKRAIFKLGNMIELDTCALHSSFSLHLDVREWQKDDSFPWVFKLTSPTEDRSTLEDTFTIIKVEELHKEVASEFDDAQNLRHLALDLQFAYADRIRKGLQLYLNEHPIKAKKMEVLVHTKVRPLHASDRFKDVRIEYVVGLAPDEDEELASADSGWYVFCNNRLLLAADKSGVTGWGRENNNPVFHPQYNQFRGFVFFECKDVDKLPWNTAKNHINTESEVYRYALPKLRQSLRHVVDYFNERKVARSNGDLRYDAPLEKARPTALSEVPKSDNFKIVVSRTSKKEPTVERISYQRPIWMVEKAIQISGAETPKKVGEFTFDYYFKKNCQ